MNTSTHTAQLTTPAPFVFTPAMSPTFRPVKLHADQNHELEFTFRGFDFCIEIGADIKSQYEDNGDFDAFNEQGTISTFRPYEPSMCVEELTLVSVHSHRRKTHVAPSPRLKKFLTALINSEDILQAASEQLDKKLRDSAEDEDAPRRRHRTSVRYC
jgi:hypothetical protein